MSRQRNGSGERAVPVSVTRLLGGAHVERITPEEQRAMFDQACALTGAPCERSARDARHRAAHEACEQLLVACAPLDVMNEPERAFFVRAVVNDALHGPDFGPLLVARLLDPEDSWLPRLMVLLTTAQRSVGGERPIRGGSHDDADVRAGYL